VETVTRRALVAALEDHDAVVEVGIGRRTDVAAALAATGTTVTATDVVDRDVPDAVRFVRDDVTDPDTAVYRDADAVYALNCPPELHRALAAVADDADAACYFTTLGGDQPAVAVERRTLPGETLYVVRE
jgi:uncharacterized UPF0146 family protein